MLEGQMLSLLSCDRVAYDTLQPFIEDNDFSDTGNIVLTQIQDYYEADKAAQDVSIDILRSRIERSYPNHVNTLGIIIDNLTTVSIPNVMQEYFEFKKHAMAIRLGTLLINGSNTPEARELMERYEALQIASDMGDVEGETFDVYMGDALVNSLDVLDRANLIQIFPESLNVKLGGGVPPGTHIVVFARPEAGKTMFVINMACGFLQQGKRVLYIGNEDPAAAMNVRVLSNLLGINKDDVLANKAVAQEMANAEGIKNFIFVQLNPGSVHNCKKLVDIYVPDILIVDQIRNLKTSKQYTKVEALEEIAKSIRDIGKASSCVTISVTQAGASADDKLVLDMGDVDFSNTGIPSTADVMIGIGTTKEYEMMGKRMISLPKNKVSGIHESFAIDVIPELSTVRSCE